MILCDVGRTLAYGLVPLCWSLGFHSLPLIFFMTAVAGALGNLFGVANIAALPDIVDKDRLHEANGRLALSQALAYVLGPLLAGVVAAHSGPVAALTIDATTFLVSAASLSVLSFGRGHLAGSPRTDRSATAGIRYLFRHPAMRALMILVVLLGLTSNVGLSAGIVDLLVFHLKRELGAGDRAVGVGSGNSRRRGRARGRACTTHSETIWLRSMFSGRYVSPGPRSSFDGRNRGSRIRSVRSASLGGRPHVAGHRVAGVSPGGNAARNARASRRGIPDARPGRERRGHGAGDAPWISMGSGPRLDRHRCLGRVDRLAGNVDAGRRARAKRFLKSGPRLATVRWSLAVPLHICSYHRVIEQSRQADHPTNAPRSPSARSASRPRKEAPAICSPAPRFLPLSRSLGRSIREVPARDIRPARGIDGDLTGPARMTTLARRALEDCLGGEPLRSNVPLLLASCNGNAATSDPDLWRSGFEMGTALVGRDLPVASAACASGLHALFLGTRLIEAGADEVIVLAVDVDSLPAHANFETLRILADPDVELPPWHPGRTGFILGEAAVALRIGRADSDDERDAQAVRAGARVRPARRRRARALAGTARTGRG